MITTITVGGQAVKVVAMPTSPGLRSVEFDMNDAVAINTSPFTGQTQAHQWPGADMLTGVMTLPPLTRAQAKGWISFLAQLRGMANGFLLGDPDGRAAAGSVAGAPVVDNTVAGGNAAMSQTLGLAGFTASATGVLKQGDYVQVGYRLHRVLDDVNADGAGKALVPVWPSLREQPVNGAAIVTANPVGVFRLGTNKRTWSSDYTRLSRLSFQVMEYR